MGVRARLPPRRSFSGALSAHRYFGGQNLEAAPLPVTPWLFPIRLRLSSLLPARGFPLLSFSYSPPALFTRCAGERQLPGPRCCHLGSSRRRPTLNEPDEE